MKSTFNVALFFALVVGMVCGSGISVPQKAFAENTLRCLVWEGYMPPEQVKKFEAYVQKKHGTALKMDIQFISDPNDFFDLIRSKKVDVISPTHNLLKDARFNFIKNNILLPLNLENIPNYKRIIPSLQNAEYAEKDGQVYCVPFVHGPYGLGYNTAHLNAPDSWNVFWDPKYKNKYSISSDYYEVNIYITALALGLSPSEMVQAENLNKPEFKDKLRYLAQNAGTMWEGVDTPEALEKQSIAAVWGFSFPELAKRGQIWRIAEPKEGTMGWVDNFAIGWSLKDKPFLKQVAEEWLNFVLSEEFQVEAVVRGLGSAPVNLNIKDRLTPEEISVFHLDDPEYFQNNRILWPILKTKRDRNFMFHSWEKATKK